MMTFDIEKTIESYKRMYLGWKAEYEQYGPPGDRTSGMKKSDLNFLLKRIEKLEKSYEALLEAFEQVKDDVEEHKEQW